MREFRRSAEARRGRGSICGVNQNWISWKACAKGPVRAKVSGMTLSRWCIWRRLNQRKNMMRFGMCRKHTPFNIYIESQKDMRLVASNWFLMLLRCGCETRYFLSLTCACAGWYHFEDNCFDHGACTLCVYRCRDRILDSDETKIWHCIAFRLVRASSSSSGSILDQSEARSCEF